MNRLDARTIFDFCRAMAVKHIEEADSISFPERTRALAVMDHVCFAVNENLTSCAGRANYKTYGVELSGPIFDQTYVVAQIIDTILHEIAHHIAYRVDREHGHGPKWIEWAELIGCSAERTHSMPRARRKSKAEVNKAEAALLSSELSL